MHILKKGPGTEKNDNTKRTHLSGKYEPAVMLILIQENNLRLKDLKDRLDFICPGRYKELGLLEAMKRLERKLIINSTKIDIKPKRRNRRYKLRSYLNPRLHPENRNNNIGGRYERWFKLGDIPVNTMSKLKNEIACHFGFENWNDGLVLIGMHTRAVYFHAHKSFNREKPAISGFENNNDSGNDNSGGGADMTIAISANEMLRNRLPEFCDLSLRTKALIQRYEKLHAEVPRGSGNPREDQSIAINSV